LDQNIYAIFTMEAGLAMNAMFSSEELCVAAGLLLVSGRVVFLVPMRCAGKPTPNLYSFLFVYPFVFIAHFLAPSRIHPALPADLSGGTRLEICSLILFSAAPRAKKDSPPKPPGHQGLIMVRRKTNEFSLRS
jgi:hypothetical protein